MFKKVVYFVAAVLLFTVFGGCASYRTQVQWAEPRPLGRDLTDAKKVLPPQKGTVESVQTEEPTGKLTLAEALSLALLRNPELAAFSYEIRLKEAQALQASLLPNPEIDLELENFAGGGAYTGFQATETTVSLTQLVPLAGKRAKRTRVAVLEGDLATWDYEIRRLEVFTEVVQAYIATVAAQERVRLNQELIKVAEEFLQSIEQRVKAGKISPAQMSRARVELANTRIELNRSLAELENSRQRLAATWGSVQPRFERVEGKLDTIIPLPPLEKLVRLVDRNPRIARWAVAMQQREAALDLARANRVPDPTLSGGFRHLNEVNQGALVAGLSIPLPFFDRNQGNIQEAKFRLKQAEYQQKATTVQVQKQLKALFNLLEASFKEVNSLKSEILPEAQNAFQTIQQGYLMGKFDFLDVLDAQRTLFRVREQYISALRNYHEMIAELEKVLGQPLAEIE